MNYYLMQMFRFVLDSNNTPMPSYKSYLKRTITKANIAISNCDIESLVVSIFGGNREGGGVPPSFLGKLNKTLLQTPTPTLPAIQAQHN